jgi:tRNA (guanine-N7-)-methyltransferase
MAQKKLKRFKEIKAFTNVLEYPENIKGKWNDLLKNENPLILELACGRGEYTIGLAELYKTKNFIGVDIKGNRLWVGAKKALVNNYLNVTFLRTQIDKIGEYFTKNEVDEIWITFPDPHLRNSKARKRLTHPKFLRLYQQFLKPGGYLHLKTDSPELFYFTKTVIDLYGLKIMYESNDLYKNENIKPELKIKTHYENLDIAKSNTIFYLCFTLPKIINDSDEILNNALNKSEV